MSEYATKNDVQEIVNKAVDDLSEVINNLAQNMHKEISELKSDVIDLKKSHDQLLNTVDGFVARIDRYETELAARDNQFNKLLEWARKVSEKTGIPLENL